MPKSFLIGLCAAFLLSCTSQNLSTKTQGIEGQVLWVEGNQMPSTDIPRNSAGSRIQRTVLIYELTHRDQCTRGEELYTRIDSRLVAQVESDSTGHFATSLPHGHYSIFTQEPDGYFANKFDGEGHVNPVTIVKGKTTVIRVKIDYKAFY